MATVVLVLLVLSGITSIVCFVMVLIKMFRHGMIVMGVVSITATLFLGFGSLLALIVGWVKAGQWGSRRLMAVWTGAIVAKIVLALVYMALAPPPPGGP